jgi:hypothetical protein
MVQYFATDRGWAYTRVFAAWTPLLVLCDVDACGGGESGEVDGWGFWLGLQCPTVRGPTRPRARLLAAAHRTRLTPSLRSRNR